jgi:hypothetical protein
MLTLESGDTWHKCYSSTTTLHGISTQNLNPKLLLATFTIPAAYRRIRLQIKVVYLASMPTERKPIELEEGRGAYWRRKNSQIEGVKDLDD